MGARMGRAHLDAEEVEGAPGGPLHIIRVERLREARPARSRLELVRRREEGLARDDVHVDPLPMLVPVLVVESALGPVLLRDAVLNGRQLLAKILRGGLLEGTGPASRALGERRGRGENTEKSDRPSLHGCCPPASSPQIAFSFRSRPHPMRYCP